ncbi:MAG: glycosyltransferase [Alcaligenes sp.]|nr:glycosyltransferase [Alcaligenes sp.]
MSLNFPVTLVIPILNEADSLPELLSEISAQTHQPDEIIFCDAGSTDGSQALIESWWRNEGWETGRCSVLPKPGAMPGAGRNAGVRAARNNWIAFIDGGITPARDWLEQLCRHAQATQRSAIFGVCHFSAREAFAKAVCALSYGHGSAHPVIPASLFKRDVFCEIGYFPENLRAAEDLVWMEALQTRYGAKEVCSAAHVSYTYFPTGWCETLRKWRVSEFNRSLGGVRRGQQMIYLLGLPSIYVIAASGGSVATSFFIVYLLLRGVFDPVRRSKDFPWWKGRPEALLIAIPLALALDISKWLGTLQWLKGSLYDWLGLRRRGHVDP